MSYTNVVIASLSQEDGAENPSGLKETAYILLKRDLLTIQKPTPSTTPASLLTISSAHVMKTDKSPIPCEIVHEKSGFESALVGEVFSKIYNPKIKVHIAQPTVDNMGGVATFKNARGLLLFRRNLVDTNFYQIGEEDMWAKIEEGTVSFGEGPTGTPGIMLTFAAHSVMPVYRYAAALPTEGA